MDDLLNSINKLHIKDQTPYHKIIPDNILKMIYNDIEYMFIQIVHENINSNIVTFELFKNIFMFKLEELKLIHDYISKYAYNMLEYRFKNSGLYYNKLDLQTYIDYYTEELYEHISLMQGC